MKILKLTSLLATAAFLIFSCSSDDNSSNSGNTELANQQNQLEDIPVPLTNLNSGISIEGATKKTGSLSSNSNLNLAVNSNEFEGYQKAGFNLEFTSTEADIAGAYLQFKDTQGNLSSSYFDIPFSSLQQNKKANTKKSNITSKFSSTQKISIGETQYVIDVNFDDAFPPGTFCAVLCIYDSANNISQPITVCVTVEAWGGNADIVGDWVLESSNYQDLSTIYCDNNQEIQAPFEQIVSEKFTLKLMNNGSFEVYDTVEYKNLDYIASTSSCTPIYDTNSDNYNLKITGQWAYNEAAKTLTLVTFNYYDLLDPQYNESYPNGELDTEGVSVDIIDSKLVITVTDIYNGEPYIYIFKRI